MPKSAGGIISFLLMSVIMTTVALFIINRIPPLRQLIAAA